MAQLITALGGGAGGRRAVWPKMALVTGIIMLYIYIAFVWQCGGFIKFC